MAIGTRTAVNYVYVVERQTTVANRVGALLATAPPLVKSARYRHVDWAETDQRVVRWWAWRSASQRSASRDSNRRLFVPK
jgi:hypothetical protein